MDGGPSVPQNLPSTRTHSPTLGRTYCRGLFKTFCTVATLKPTLPDNFYSLVLKSGGPINSVNYSNKEVDALIDKAASSDSEAERKGLCRQIRTITSKDSPLVFVHYETLHYLMNTNVTGSRITPTLSLDMENIGFTE